MKPGVTGKPTALRLLHGDQKSRINFDEPKPEPGHPVCPPEASPEVRAIWGYTLDHLIVMGVATGADRDALLCYCEAVATHRKASALLAKSPILIQGHRGMVRNPALAIQRDAAGVIRAYAHEFGLTPSARSEIRMGGAKSGRDSAERYLTG
jgi:P27 family predicted phage terminase small subunit